jgi:hypothetical protein
MRFWRSGSLAIAVVIAGCTSTIVPTAGPASFSTPGPTAPPAATPIATPDVSCDLAPADCSAALAATLSAAAGLNGQVIRVELSRGVVCPTPGLLFADTTCPAGGMPPPEGGQWIGNARVSFAGSSAQAYMNIAKHGQAVRPAFIDLATPPPSATPVSTPDASGSEAAADCQLALDHPDLADVVVDSGVPTLSGAFIVTLQQWTTWEEKRTRSHSPLPLENPDKLVAVCFIDGDFTSETSGPPGNDRHHTRIVVLVYDNFVEPHMYGTKESIPVEDPAAMSLPQLGISNGTTLTVTLVVNGAVVETLAPQTVDSSVPLAGLPPLPWTVEARSPSGRVLVSMPVNEGDVHTEHTPGDGTSSAGDSGRVDLSCGRLDIWAGTRPVGPGPGPGTPGDCAR